MDYHMPVSEFLKAQIDLEDFYGKLYPRLKELDQKHGFFVTLAEKPHKPTRDGNLKGLPISVKDNICVQGLPCTAGSRILETYRPPFDSTVSHKVKGEGGVIVGKTQQDEFGFGTFCTNSGFKVPKNPLDTSRSCGGSSGGAAGLAAALDFPHIALGQSTGGSISAPASFCGVVGLTPTYGLVSRYGLIDYANSLDKIGPIGKSVQDVALMLSVIAGHDHKDSTSLGQKATESPSNKGEHHAYARHLESPVKGMKIGVPKEYFGEGVDEKVSERVWAGIKALEGQGVHYEEISLPNTKHALSAYYIIACAEASTNLAKFCGMRYGAEQPVDGSFNEYFSQVRSSHFGEEAKRRILLGTYARMAGFRDRFYLKAMQARTLIIQEFQKAFSKYDVLLAPTMPIIAPKFSEIEALSPVENYMMDVLTVAPNLAGIPHLTVPCGHAHSMPVGLHIMGGHLQEPKVLQIGSCLEKN